MQRMVARILVPVMSLHVSPVGRHVCLHARHLYMAKLLDACTAVIEAAAGGSLCQAWNRTRDAFYRLRRAFHQPWQCGQQPGGVWMPRRGKQGFYRSFLDDATAVHDQGAVTYLSHDTQVVGDQQHGGTGITGQFADLLQNLRLCCDIHS